MLTQHPFKRYSALQINKCILWCFDTEFSSFIYLFVFIIIIIIINYFIFFLQLFTLLFLAWITVMYFRNKCWFYTRKYSSQWKWSQMKASPLKYTQVPLVWQHTQHCPITNCPWILCITNCDRRPLQIPTRTLSMAQHSIVGLLQSAVIWKAVIGISPTHLVTLLITIVVQVTWGAMCWYQQTEPRGGLGCLKKVGGVPCCATLRKIPLLVCQKCISPWWKQQPQCVNAQQNKCRHSM